MKLLSVHGGRHRLSRRRASAPLVLTVGATGLAVMATVGILPASGTLERIRAAARSDNLVVNGTFESNVTGWRADHRPTQVLEWTTPGRAGSSGAAQLSATNLSMVGPSDQAHSIASTVKGETVEVTAWVRALTPGLSGRLRLREVASATEVAVGRTPFTLAGTGWQQVTVTYVAAWSGSTIDLTVQAWQVAPGRALRVADVQMFRTAAPAPTTSAPAPTTSAPAPAPAVTATPTQSTPTVTATPTQTTPTVTATPTQTTSGGALYGMSAPDGEWDARAAEVGSGLESRRIFLTSLGASLGKVTEACDDGLYPIVSFKTAPYSWAQVAAGNADAELANVRNRLVAECDLFVSLHHEPSGDGTASDWAAMHARAFPILGAGVGVSVGPIANGFFWSNGGQGLTDAQIAEYIPQNVINASDIIMSDTYHGGTMASPGEDAGVKIRNMSAWATRHGVQRLGLGEWNGITAGAITNACNAIDADPRFGPVAIFNSLNNNRAGVSWQLTGERLTAFKACLN